MITGVFYTLYLSHAQRRRESVEKTTEANRCRRQVSLNCLRNCISWCSRQTLPGKPTRPNPLLADPTQKHSMVCPAVSYHSTLFCAAESMGVAANPFRPVFDRPAQAPCNQQHLLTCTFHVYQTRTTAASHSPLCNAACMGFDR